MQITRDAQPTATLWIVDNDDEPRDLRARNKQTTRQAISVAALRLAIEQGPAGLKLVRVADIASAAGVSPRTYNNYFSSREEAICAVHADHARQLGRALLARPAGEPLAEAVTAAVVECFADPEPDRVGLAMIMSAAELRGEALKAFTMAEEPLTAALAERTGTKPRDALSCQVMAAAIAAAVRVAGEHWLSTTAPTPFADVLRDALRYVLPGRHPEDL
jgi:AcrR family transcriptional regulator